MRCRLPPIILVLLLALGLMLGTGCKAATLSPTAVECSSLYPGNAKATFYWIPVTPNGVVQYLDLSVLNNGFAPGTFLSAGPLAGDANSFIWDGLLPNTTHYFRVNTLSASGWQPSATGYVTTLPCSTMAPMPIPGASVGAVIGGLLVADDGQFLGLVSCSLYDVDSIFNRFGMYGSRFSSTSIWNEFGIYGGKFSMYSPFNRFTSTPPYIFVNGRFAAYLTQDGFLFPKVTPTDLIVACGADDYFEYLP